MEHQATRGLVYPILSESADTLLWSTRTLREYPILQERDRDSLPEIASILSFLMFLIAGNLEDIALN